jgi:hypothetical protein
VAGGRILTRRDSLFMLITVQPEIEDFRLELSVFSIQLKLLDLFLFS